MKKARWRPTMKAWGEQAAHVKSLQRSISEIGLHNERLRAQLAAATEGWRRSAARVIDLEIEAAKSAPDSRAMDPALAAAIKAKFDGEEWKLA